MTARNPSPGRHDRWADWVVVTVLAVALLLGWGIRSLAEGRRDTFTNADAGLSVRYPRNWLVKPGQDWAFQVVNPNSGTFKTTYEVRVWPIEASEAVTPTLAVVLNNASLSRARQVTAYRLFDLESGREVGGRPTMEATYVYVHESSDLFTQRIPVVVRGLDVAVAGGQRVYVFSLLAAADALDEAEQAFRRFVASAEVD